jgi:UDP-N-acetylglucosamine 2-epimerase (non-hydrolysing)
MRILVPFGTRPEIVKLAPVVAAMREADDDVVAVATGQHDDPLLSDAFFADLSLEPDVRHVLPEGEGDRIGALLSHAYEDLADGSFDLVVALGDTNTVPAYALAARRFGVPVAHLEAGLRSFNPRSLEELNRRVGAAAASLQLAPTDLARRFLLDEGIAPERIQVVGNPITDVLRSLAPPRNEPATRHGIIVTAHRATNVDVPERLARLVELVRRLADEFAPVRFPLHPRTRARLEAAGALAELQSTDGLLLEAPLRFVEMLEAIAQARMVVTDSGGLQEEASWFGVPVLVLRTTTPRWEGVVAGTTALVGLEVERALAMARELASEPAQMRAWQLPCPYGDGHVGPRVAGAIHEAAAAGLLSLVEPALGQGVPAAVLDVVAT